MPFLVRPDGTPPGQIIELEDEEVLIGRELKCGIVLNHTGVSRNHAVLRRMGDGYHLVDLGSRNFTLLNNRKLTEMQPYILRDGDWISICDVSWVFYEHLPKEPEEPPSEKIVITGGIDETTLHTMDASRSDQTWGVRPETKLRAILDITHNLSRSLEIETTAPRLLETLLDIFPQAERAFLVLLKDGSADRPVIRNLYSRARPHKRGAAARPTLGRPGGEEARLNISRTVMNYVLAQRKAVLSRNTDSDPNLPTSDSIANLQIRSLMCAPVLSPDGLALGILQIDTTSRDQFKQEDLDLLVAVAGQAGIAIQYAVMLDSILARERVERDLRLAEQVQRRFLPQTVPVHAGYEFFAHYRAAYEVGGDYYDFVPLAADRVAIALGDVAGKGVSAALMMARFSSDTRLHILTEPDPAHATTRLNQELCDAGLEERFITMSLGVLETPSRMFTFSSAGHPPLLVRRADGRVDEYGQEISGFPLGIIPGTTYQQLAVELFPGDVAVVYSDGVTDGRNPAGELFDTSENQRLKQILARGVGGPEALGRALLQEIREFCQGQAQADDITLVCFGPSVVFARESDATSFRPAQQ